MARRRTGHRDETELSPLLKDDDETLTDEAGWSGGSNEQLRLMVLGGDDALLDEACGTILGDRENRDAFKFGELMPRKAQVCGRQVSVLKTPSYWLKHLKSKLFFSNGVKSLKKDLQFFESQLFPGTHAFLLVHRDVKNSGRENYLLRALRDVFGEEVLDYCKVLFMDRARNNNPEKNTCLKMCGGRHHILQNTDESVQQLFKKTEAMTQTKSSSFFTNHLECFRKAEIYFKAEFEEKENQLKVANEKLHRQLKQLQDNKKQLENKLTECTVKETSLNKKQRCLDEREKQLDDRERFLDERQKQLDDREREVTQTDARSSEHHQTTADTAGAELMSRDDSQASGPLEIQKPVKRNSKEFDPPFMS